MKSLKLNNLEQNQLSSQELNNLKGGDWTCSCGCYYADNGGSSVDNNGYANASYSGRHSGGNGIKATYTVTDCGTL